MDARGNTHICLTPILGGDSTPSPSSPLLFYLIVVRGGIPGTMLPLTQNAVSLGRSADNTFQLHEGTVSRRHVLVSIDSAGKTQVTDLGSTNGTFVDGQRLAVHESVFIRDGSRIQLGSTTLLKFLKLDPCEEGFQRELFERSVRDNLTGLYNRGYFLSQIGPLADLNALRELGLAVILVDIDHFKTVNDTHGHDFGDLVLKQVAGVLRDCTRAEDLVARYGGEEFIIALPCESAERAVERAEQIRSQLARHPLDAFGNEFRITASLGVSFRGPASTRSISASITSADMALYEAKRRGRNRVVSSLVPPREPVCQTDSAESFAVF